MDILENISKRNFYPVIPLLNNSCNPFIKWGDKENWINEESKLLSIGKELEYYNEKNKTNKVGIITGYALIGGKPSGIMILDLDRNHKNGADGIKSFYDFIESLDLEKEEKEAIYNTYTIKSPRGGLHLYFKYREGWKTTADILPGVDIRTDGGIIVLPGTNRKYWQNDYKDTQYYNNIYSYEVTKNNEISDIPDKVFLAIKDMLNIQPKDVDSSTKKDSRGAKIDFYSATHEGEGRDNKTFKYACSLLSRGITDSRELYNMVLAYDLLHNKPPLGEDEIKIKVESSFKYLNEAKEKIKEENLIGFDDYKDSFIKFMDDNFRYVLNRNDEYKYAFWNDVAWILQTPEEAALHYGDFYKRCKEELIEVEGLISNKEYEKLKSKILKWNSTTKVTETFGSIKRDSNLVIDIKKIDNNLLCTADGKIIDFINFEIREAKKEDYVLNTLAWTLKDKEESDKFMEDNIFPLLQYSLNSRERLEFLNDFIANKLLGRRIQACLFNYGAAASGKSFFKKMALQLLKDKAYDLTYSYLTTKHVGHGDTSRDDKLVALNKKLLFLSSEPDDSDILVMGRFKDILSGDSCKNARRTGKGEETVDLSLLDGLVDLNGFPSFTGYDDAVERRLFGINWEKSIPFEKRDPTFYEKIVKQNFDYVFSYYVYKAMEFKDKDFKVSDYPILIKDTEVIRENADSFTLFCNRFLEIQPGFNFNYPLSIMLTDYIKFIEKEELQSSIPVNNKSEKYQKSYLKKRFLSMEKYKDVEFCKKENAKGFKDVVYTIKGEEF